jgi:hypothetical protein
MKDSDPAPDLTVNLKELGFSSLEERKFFSDLATKFIDRAYVKQGEGVGRKRPLTEDVIWNGYHQITLSRWDVQHCGGIKPFYERNNIDLSVRLRKMVTGK